MASGLEGFTGEVYSTFKREIISIFFKFFLSVKGTEGDFLTHSMRTAYYLTTKPKTWGEKKSTDQYFSWT